MNAQQDIRQLKGQEIAARYRITQQNNLWLVPSQTSSKKYKVDLQNLKCNCLDHETRKTKCKHLFAVEFTIERQFLEAIDGKPQVQSLEGIPKVKRPTYPQVWPAYNQAQTNEKKQFQYLLFQLCKGVGEPAQYNGRPRHELEDVLFTCAFKVYSTFSGRRFMTDLREAKAKGYLSQAVPYNTMFRYMGSEVLTAYLKMLIEESAKPLSVIEKDFAVDSTGISGCRFVQWVHAKYSDPKIVDAKDWIKMHLICGIITNVVTAVEITDKYAGDAPRFAPLVQATRENFYMQEVSADKAYLSDDNLRVVLNSQAMPYIPFKSNSNPHAEKASDLWTRMYHFFAYNQDKFFKHYHKRSNVESTVMMIKAKFGDSLRSRTEQAQINEALCKVLCHNICCLIQSMYELGLKPKFWSEIV